MPLGRILVVEDYQPFRKVVCSSLQQLTEFQVAEASDGLEAVQKARELQPDLVLMDIGLPKLNGIDASRQILNLCSNSKVIFVSQESDLDVVRETFHLGGRGYVHKPRASTALIPAIRAVLAGSQFVSHGFEFNRGADSDHRHSVQFYSDDAAFLKSSTSFVADSLQVADAVVVVVARTHREALARTLSDAGCDIDGAIQKGTYFSLDAEDVLSQIMVNGMPDMAAFASCLIDPIESVVGRTGTKQPRVAMLGECAGLLCAAGNLDAALCLETPRNEKWSNYRFDVLCNYRQPQNCDDDPAFHSVCAAHSAVYWR
jgi:DNA-binding response OmpR family regulator